MLGIDPRAARATWTVILIALLCLVNLRYPEYVFHLHCFSSLRLFARPDRGFHRPRSALEALADTGAGYRLSRAGGGNRHRRRSGWNQRRDQANKLAHSISELLKPEQTLDLPLPQPVKPIGAQILSVLRKAIEENYQQICKPFHRPS